MKFLKNKKIVIILLLVFIGAGVAWAFPKPSISEGEIKTVKVERGDLFSIISVSGQIDAQEKAQVRFQTSGQLVWVGVAEGERVRKWQALASLNKRELEKKLEKELNDFMTQKWTFDQTHDDYQEEKDNAVITKEIERILDKAQFSLSNQVIAVELVDLAIKYATIYSPIDGIVTEIDSPLPGVNITPAQATFTIVNPDSLAFYLKVNEIEVVNLIEGQEVDIRLDAFPNRVFAGQVAKIGFTPLSGQGTYYQVIVALEEKDPAFRVGMGGDGEILIESKNGVLTVPESALVKRSDQYWVFQIVDGRALKKPVIIGLTTDEGVEVVEGLTEGEIVVSSGVSKVSDGQKI
ncbi:MAG: efflux RND transporter periplasmic adaptor subunit [Candidatus Shapirobacteria bacterium]|nr:efflux RND transporter periplasmic adaptor subunit [Candidatus Shapirobacteria bacterium]MDD5073770.1 efflux RND transporter periplasmic adaptor subunit [Candidatus Shapirobacteria bacterium]MDD5481629.1 efflux RND transporter periplasmic adaptor subunit [Candidatus Shapirobacteria bacterium]